MALHQHHAWPTNDVFNHARNAPATGSLNPLDSSPDPTCTETPTWAEFETMNCPSLPNLIVPTSKMS